MKSQKLAYQTVPDGIRGNVKSALNAVLRPVGLEIGSTLKQRIEDGRLLKLESKGHWEGAKYTQGLTLNDDTALRFLRETCLPYQSEYRNFSPTPNGDDSQFFLQNGWFGSVDAEVLYSVVRRFQPGNIVEVGSGFSTRAMRRAISDGKLGTKITSIDPHPNTSVQPYSDEYIKSPVEDVDASQILNLLNAGDILFIDSSHTVTIGGDVPYLFLEVLPQLPVGVLIHVHDIFIPFDYPKEWAMNGWGWNEQYLLHAFLAFNQTYEILWPANYMWKYHPDEVLQVVPNTFEASQPSSFWIRKIQ